MLARKTWCLFFTLAMGLANSAFAQVTPEQQSAIRSNCRSDFMSKCSGVTPGGKEALACLQKNVGTLSSGCKTAVSATLPKPAAAAPVAAPAAPAAKVETPAAPAATAQPKPPVQPRPVTAAKPLAPKVERSAPTKSAAPAPQTASAPPAPPPAPPPKAATPVDAAVMVRACKIDLVRHCSGVGVGDGRKVACLTAHGPDLTARCRTALKVTAPIR